MLNQENNQIHSKLDDKQCANGYYLCLQRQRTIKTPSLSGILQVTENSLQREAWNIYWWVHGTLPDYTAPWQWLNVWLAVKREAEVLTYKASINWWILTFCFPQLLATQGETKTMWIFAGYISCKVKLVMSWMNGDFSCPVQRCEHRTTSWSIWNKKI